MWWVYCWMLIVIYLGSVLLTCTIESKKFQPHEVNEIIIIYKTNECFIILM